MDRKLRALKTRPNNNNQHLFSSRLLKVVLELETLFKIYPDETKLASQLIFKHKIVPR